MPDAARQLDIFSTALSVIADSFSPASSLNSKFSIKNSKSPVLYAPNGSVLPDSTFSYRRSAAKRTGSMKNWIPQRFYDKGTEATEREQIVERAIDLTNNDPNASGIVDTFATTVIGSGLVPHPTLNADIINLPKEEIRALQTSQHTAYQRWYPFADAAERMSFGSIQYVVERSIVRYGEYIVLCHMIDDPLRPYSLALQVINPLRLKTPSDLSSSPAMKDGVEMGEYGQPVAYWIKKSTQLTGSRNLADVSSNFLRVPARQGHRWNVLHGFITNDPEQTRGITFFAPAMKFFRDLNDYLDAELVSNIVTAAFSLFIEAQSGTDPFNIATNFATTSEDSYKSDGSTVTTRFQEMIPGQIMYGNTGEKPHSISANRPGATFEPFTKVIKKAIAMSLNIPYPVIFKDVEGVNFAGFRSAMLDAWRVFTFHRTWLGQGFCQKIYTMLQEEAYLRGEFNTPDFYTNILALTHADWRGSPKGDIEPIKAAQGDILLIQNNLKTRAEAIAERGGDVRTTFDQLEEEEEMMKDRGLMEGAILDPAAIKSDEKPDGEVDDMEGAGNEGM